MTAMTHPLPSSHSSPHSLTPNGLLSPTTWPGTAGLTREVYALDLRQFTTLSAAKVGGAASKGRYERQADSHHSWKVMARL